MSAKKWHFPLENPNDVPDPGKRVIICVGEDFVGEGWMMQDKSWQRYCDFEPVEKWMRQPVTAWTDLPASPFKKRETEGKFRV